MEPITMQLAATLPAGQIQRSGRTAAVAAMFGLGLEAQKQVLFHEFTLTLRPGMVVLITGPSGSGKTTLLKTIRAGLQTHGINVITLSEIPLPADHAVVDCFAAPLDATLAHLSRAGLSEARTLLRSPAALSEGQQFRYRVAQFLASDSQILVADEFAATLDRVTAKLLSWQLNKFIHGNGNMLGKTVLTATTHYDLAEDLCPDVAIYKGFGAEVWLRERNCSWQETRGKTA